MRDDFALHDAEALVKLEKQAQFGMTRKVKILIVEDEASVAMTMRFLLGIAGCKAEIAAIRARAIQMAETGHFNLITLDVNLQGENGFDICRELKKNPRLRNIPIVFVTGRCSLEDRQRGLDAGAVDYITKPFETFEFAPRLLSHIKTKGNFAIEAAMP